MTQLLSPLTSTPYPSATNNAITDLLQVPNAVLWLEKYVTLRFVSTAARDAAIGSPEDGMICYINSGSNRIAYFYNGLAAAWQILWMAGPAAWTPVFTSGLTIGNGSLTGIYQISNGHTVDATVQFTLGSTSAVPGVPLCQFPVQVSASYVANQCCGSGATFDTSAGGAGRFAASAEVNSTSAGGFGNFLLASPSGQVNTTTPMTWAAGDVWSANIRYFTV